MLKDHRAWADDEDEDDYEVRLSKMFKIDKKMSIFITHFVKSKNVDISLFLGCYLSFLL